MQNCSRAEVLTGTRENWQKFCLRWFAWATGDRDEYTMGCHLVHQIRGKVVISKVNEDSLH
jgi:hypothetical protein